jgi:hypothetical protein
VYRGTSLGLGLAEAKKNLDSDYMLEGCNAAKINNLIYAQCVTYIRSEEGKTLNHDVWTGGNPPRVAAVPLVGPGKGWRTILCGLGGTYTEDSPTPFTALNLIQHNTSDC